MKSKPKKTKRTILIFSAIIFLALMLCFEIYYLMDNVWNGTFVDWFSRNYMRIYDTYLDDGTPGVVRELDWYKIKNLLLFILCAIVVIGGVIVLIITQLYTRKKVNKTVTDISDMIHSYMTNQGEAVDIFPKEYAEVSTQIVEIKSTMQRHEQLLKEESSRKNDLIVYLAHDLKTPLTSIIGYLSLLQEAPDMPAEQKAKYVNITLDKAQRLEKLINEFFDITRFSLTHLELEKGDTDLKRMLEQMCSEFGPVLAQRGMTCQLDLPGELRAVCDPDKIARVFDNLLNNACHYAYSDSVLRVAARAEETKIVMTFCNAGPTIPPEKLARMFEQFFRLDTSRGTRTGNAGLGLAIAKEIVEAHGGTITARSEGEEMLFTVTLPR